MKPLVERALEMLTVWYPDHPGVSNFTVAQEELAERLAGEVAEYPDLINVDDVIRAALVEADRTMINEGRRFLNHTNRGEGPLPLDEFYDSLIALGNNDRVRIGDMGLAEYRRADALRFKNVSSAQDLYNAFLDRFRVYLPGFEKGLTVREIQLDDTA